MKQQDTILTSKLQCITAMIIFGTIGIFVHYIPLPSSVIAFVRGIVGAVFLLLFTVFKKRKISKEQIKSNLILLCLSGAFIGVNWILLFESYQYTTVATATLCYYMAPIFVMLASPFLLKEKLSGKKICCIILALTGMVFVSGIMQTGISIYEIRGICCGLGAAVFYSLVIISNKKMKPIDAYDKTMVQLIVAAVVVLPYILLTGVAQNITLDMVSIGLLLLIGIVHTGLAYTLYFGSMKELKAQTVAIFSYIDPVVAIILSALVLKEKMELTGIVGAVLILGAAFISELPEKNSEKKKKTTILIPFLLVIGCMAFALAFANYTNYLQGTIKVEINGEQAKIYNVACIGENDGQEEKLIVKEQEKGVWVKCKALPYDAYTFYYDVETEDGVKHFSFRIVKTHTGGPIERFQYEMKLRKEEEWVAQVLLVEKDAEGEIKKIPLSEDETAYVQLGP